jgi:hypothetical protein
MRYVTITILCVIAILSGLWAWNFSPSFRTKIEDFFSANTFQTLEVRYSAETIMDRHKKELLKDNEHVFLAPSLKFYPYLLMEVKYNRSYDKTSEGVILWGLVDGEMVINTSTWEKTHGFRDCIASNATRQEFRIFKIPVFRSFLKRSWIKISSRNIQNMPFALRRFFAALRSNKSPERPLAPTLRSAKRRRFSCLSIALPSKIPTAHR